VFKRWRLMVFLLGAMACAYVVPRADVPETAYNEIDSPISFAAAVPSGVKVVQLDTSPVILLEELAGQDRNQRPSRLALVSLSSRIRHHHSIQDLLCTFLI